MNNDQLEIFKAIIEKINPHFSNALWECVKERDGVQFDIIRPFWLDGVFFDGSKITIIDMGGSVLDSQSILEGDCNYLNSAWDSEDKSITSLLNMLYNTDKHATIINQFFV